MHVCGDFKGTTGFESAGGFLQVGPRMTEMQALTLEGQLKPGVSEAPRTPPPSGMGSSI